jgi:hypothetical protein
VPSGPAEWSDQQLMLVLDGRQPDRRGVTLLHTHMLVGGGELQQREPMCERELMCVIRVVPSVTLGLVGVFSAVVSCACCMVTSCLV